MIRTASGAEARPTNEQPMQVAHGLTPINRSLIAGIASGAYMDLRLFTPAGLEATRNCASPAECAKAIGQLPDPGDFSEWSSAFAVYLAAMASLSPQCLANMVGHLAFVTVAERAFPLDFVEYDRSFRSSRNLGDANAGWRRVGGSALDHEFVLLCASHAARAGSGRPPKRVSEGGASGSQPGAYPSQGSGDISRQICFRFNDGRQCDERTCPRRHVCRNRRCHGEHPKTDCPMEQSSSRRRSRSRSRPRSRSRSPLAKKCRTDRQVSTLVSPAPQDVTPYIFQAWRDFTKNFPDSGEREYVLKGLCNGFRLGFDARAKLGKVKGNAVAVQENPEVVRQYLREEREAGVLLGPFSFKPDPALHVNKINVIPKNKEVKAEDLAANPLANYRLIVDLSHPPNVSVNDGIGDEEARVSYCSLQSILDEVVELGPKALLGKIDFARAYRQVPVHPDDRQLLGMKFQGEFFVDLVLPFGGRSCAKIFSRVAELARFAFEERALASRVRNYLDDFISLAAGDPEKAKRDFKSILDTAKAMGIPLSEKKIRWPGPEVDFLGFHINAPSQSVSLPEEKRLRYRKCVKELAGRKVAKQQDLLSVSGKLIHVADVLPQGKPFVRSIFNRAYSVKKKSHWVKLDEEVRADLEWWQETLKDWVGTALLCTGKWAKIPDLHFTSDASGALGLGMVYGEFWCAEPWPSFPGRVSNIASLELVPIVVAASLWGAQWSRKKVLFHCDNIAVVHAVNGWLPKDRHLVALLKRLAKLSIKFNFRVSAVHIPGVENVDADDLSRRRIDKFLARHPGRMNNRVRVEAAFLQELTSSPAVQERTKGRNSKR